MLVEMEVHFDVDLDGTGWPSFMAGLKRYLLTASMAFSFNP